MPSAFCICGYRPNYWWSKRQKNFKTPSLKCMARMSSFAVRHSFSSSQDNHSICNRKPQDKAKGPSPGPPWGEVTAVRSGMSRISLCPISPHPRSCHGQKEVQDVLAWEIHGQGVGRRNDEAHGGHEHVHAARASHVPLAPFVIVLQDTLVPFVDDFLQGKQHCVLALSTSPRFYLFAQEQKQQQWWCAVSALLLVFFASIEADLDTTQHDWCFK